MSELSQAATNAVQAFHELLQADDADNSQPPPPVVFDSDALRVDTDPYQDCREPHDAANSQPPSPAASVISLSSASEEDYAELGDVVEQVCGACYYKKIVRLTSYKAKCKKLTAQNWKLKNDRATLLKQCQNWRAKCMSLTNPAPPKRTTKEDHQSIIQHQGPIQMYKKDNALKRKHQSSSSRAMQQKVPIGQAPSDSTKMQQEAKRRFACCRR